MKIRMLGNSIRLRLSQRDINALKQAGQLMASVNFPNGETLKYSLNKWEKENINIDFQNNEIKTHLPSDLLSEWTSTDRVGFEKEILMSDGNHFKILIEKDFKCLTDRPEDESDLFPHPKEDHSNC